MAGPLGRRTDTDQGRNLAPKDKSGTSDPVRLSSSYSTQSVALPLAPGPLSYNHCFLRLGRDLMKLTTAVSDGDPGNIETDNTLSEQIPQP